MERIVFIGANNPETQRMMTAVKRVTAVEFLGFIDNDPAKSGKQFCGLPVIGGYDVLSQLDPKTTRFVNLITRDCLTRYETSKVVADAGFGFSNFVHPSVDLNGVELGAGNYIQEAVVLQAGVAVGKNSSIHIGALIGHESRIGSSTFIAHGVVMSGLVHVEDGVFVGAGTVIVPRVKIGSWAIIGAGCVIIKDIPSGSVVVGNPARIIRKITLPSHTGSPWNE